MKKTGYLGYFAKLHKCTFTWPDFLFTFLLEDCLIPQYLQIANRLQLYDAIWIAADSVEMFGDVPKPPEPPKEIWFCDFSLHLPNNYRLQMNEANRNRPHETKERVSGFKGRLQCLYVLKSQSLKSKKHITLALALKSLMSKVLTLSHRCKQMHILGGWFVCFSSKKWVTCFQTKLFRTSEQLPIISGGNTSNY